MKNQEIDLTVVICMYNAEKYIEETLQCIIHQTYSNFNLLIIDDCCTDNSVQIVEDFFKSNNRQYKIDHIYPNQGLCAGRYYAECNVNTKYILFVDADDCPKPTLVEKLYNKIKSDSNLMAVGCYLDFIDSNGKKLNGGIYLGETNKEGFYKRAEKKKLIFMQPTAIYDRELALSVGGHNIKGFPEGKPRYQDLCEDLDLWTRMSDLYIEGKAIVVVPEVLCLYRKHEKALSTNSKGMILRMKHIKKNLLLRRDNKKEISFIDFLKQLPPDDLKKIEKDAMASDLFRESYYSIKHGVILKGLHYLLRALILNPDYVYSKIKNNLYKSQIK